MKHKVSDFDSTCDTTYRPRGIVPLVIGKVLILLIPDFRHGLCIVKRGIVTSGDTLSISLRRDDLDDH